MEIFIMRSKWPFGFSVMLLVGFAGCQGYSDPVVRQVEAEGANVQVAPEATLDPQAAYKAQQERERKQAEADAKAGRR
jgi:hypothetical protein